MEFCDYEYSVDQKNEGAFILAKIGMIFLYIAFAGGYFAAIYISRIFTLGALIPIALWILVYFTWRYVKPEYKYHISGSELAFTVIYGSKTKKDKTKIRINEAYAILPLSEAEEEIKNFSPKKKYNALPSKKEADAYVILYTNEKGKRCSFLFKATAEALHLLKIYNSKTTIRKTAL